MYSKKYVFDENKIYTVKIPCKDGVEHLKGNIKKDLLSLWNPFDGKKNYAVFVLSEEEKNIKNGFEVVYHLPIDLIEFWLVD